MAQPVRSRCHSLVYYIPIYGLGCAAKRMNILAKRLEELVKKVAPNPVTPEPWRTMKPGSLLYKVNSSQFKSDDKREVAQILKERYDLSGYQIVNEQIIGLTFCVAPFALSPFVRTPSIIIGIGNVVFMTVGLIVFFHAITSKIDSNIIDSHFNFNKDRVTPIVI